MSGIIYCITSRVNGKQYVGQSKSKKKGGSPESQLSIRFSSHKCKAFDKENSDRNYNHGLYVDMRKYGIENFIASIIEIVENEDEILEREKFWINKLDTVKNGYNVYSYHNQGQPMAEHIREAIRKANIGRKQPPEEIERRKQAMKAEFERKKKKIMIIETGEIFDSLTDCAKIKFGSIDVASNISAVINGRRKSYRNLTFKYL